MGSDCLTGSFSRQVIKPGMQRVPWGRLLVGTCRAQHGRLIERPAGELESDRQARLRKSTRDRYRRDTHQTELRGCAYSCKAVSGRVAGK